MPLPVHSGSAARARGRLGSGRLSGLRLWLQEGGSQTAVVVRDAELARRLWSRLEPIHVVTYFSPEVRAALSGAGYKGFWMGYFAGRAAPMGPAGPEVVFATFYNFSIAHISRAIPDAWTFAPPSAAAAGVRQQRSRRGSGDRSRSRARCCRVGADGRPRPVRRQPGFAVAGGTGCRLVAGLHAAARAPRRRACRSVGRRRNRRP